MAYSVQLEPCGPTVLVSLSTPSNLIIIFEIILEHHRSVAMQVEAVGCEGVSASGLRLYWRFAETSVC